MSFADAIRTCLTKYATFTGRARRSEFWYFALFSWLVQIVLYALGGAIKFPMLGALGALALLLPTLAASVRRLHDTGKSGWMLLIGLIPLVGPIILIVFYVTDTTPAGDKYGPAPKLVAQPGV